MSLVGRKNVYTCGTCGWQAVTIDLVQGVTPFMIGCEREGCRGDAYSAFYRVDQAREPTHEWYRPDAAEARKLGKLWKHHLENGGLKLRLRAAA